MTNLGPGLGNATMRGDQVWVETVEDGAHDVFGDRNGEAQHRGTSGYQNEPSAQQAQNRGQQVDASVGQQSQGGASGSSQGQARREQRLHAIVSAQHTLYATRYQRILDLIATIQRDLQQMGACTSQEQWQRARGDLRDLEGDIEQLHATWLGLLEIIEDLDYLQQIRELGTRDLQQLSKALSQLRARLSAVRTGPEIVREYVPAPASAHAQDRRQQEVANTGARVEELGSQRPETGLQTGPGQPLQQNVGQTRRSEHRAPQDLPRAAATIKPKVKIDPLRVAPFSGDLLQFSEFKRNFVALVEQQGYSDDVCLMYLKQALPKELDYLMVGVRLMSVAWQRPED